jgi:hypothetical protein
MHDFILSLHNEKLTGSSTTGAAIRCSDSGMIGFSALAESPGNPLITAASARTRPSPWGNNGDGSIYFSITRNDVN